MNNQSINWDPLLRNIDNYNILNDSVYTKEVL